MDNEIQTIEISKKVFLKGKSYNNIMNFAIITTIGNNEKQREKLMSYLKFYHYLNLSQDTYIVFNIAQKNVARMVGSSGLFSFVYCYPDGNNMVNEYWEKKKHYEKYNSVKNPFILIDKTLNDETIGTDLFEMVDNELKKGIDNVRNKFYLDDKTDDEILEYLYNRIGTQFGAYYSAFRETIHFTTLDSE